VPRTNIVEMSRVASRAPAHRESPKMQLPEERTATSSRWFSLSLAALVVGLIVWSCFGTIDVVASAEGIVLPVGRDKRIAAMEAGSVRAIHVDDGQRVAAGQPLVDLDPILRESDRDRIKNDLLMARVAAARYRALLQPLSRAVAALSLPAELNSVGAEDQRQLLMAARERYENQLAAIDREIERNDANLRTNQVTIKKYRLTAPLFRERADMRRQLAEAGFGPRLTFLEAEIGAVEREQQIIEATEQRAGLEASIKELREQKARVEAEFRENTLSRLVEAERMVVSLTGELKRAEQHVAYQYITAPASGTVTHNNLHTIGGAVAAGQVLMTIVPDDGELEIEAGIANRDVGFVRVGQKAEIKIDAFQYTVHGTLPGEVRDVARDVLKDEKLGLVFPTRIKLRRQTMTVDGEDVPLSAGMHVNVDVITDKRRVIDFLASPFLRMSSDAMRQR
jgi:membrane fusion protein, hemolysin D